MSHKKRKLYQSKHPLGSYPFEAFLSVSWKAVEHIKIEGGTPTLHFTHNQKRVLKKNPGPDIRIRSRKATLSDCSCFLRPGIDVCVSSASQQDNSSAKICLEPEWVDAKIRSVQRKRHVSECSCEYFVNLYVNQGRYDPEKRVLSTETKVVGINQISILQKLDLNPCEDQHYRWDLSEDCFKAQKTRLFAGKFLSDFSWLVVASALKQISFCVRSVESKIVYQILGSEHSRSSLNYSSLEHVNFRLDNGLLLPIVSHVIPSDNNKADQDKDAYEDEISPVSCIEGLRRSKRRNIEPERYLGYEDASKLNFVHIRTGLPKSSTRDYDEKADVDILPNCLEKDIDSCQNIKKIHTFQEVLVNNSSTASGTVKLENVDEKGHEAQLVMDPLPDGGGPVALDQPFLNTDSMGNSRYENCVFSEYNHLTHSPELNRKIVHPWAFEPYDHQSEVPDHHQSVVRDSLPDGGGPVAFDHSFLNTNSTGNSWHESCVFSECNHLTHSPELNRKIVDPWIFESYDKSSVSVNRENFSALQDMDTENRWEGIHSNEEIQGKEYHSPMTRSKSRREERTYKGRPLSDAENSAKEIGDKSSGCYDFGTCNIQKKDLPGLQDMDSENRQEGVHSDKEIEGEKYHPPMTRSKTRELERTYKDRSSSDAENFAKVVGDKSFGCYNFGTCNVQRKDVSGLVDMDDENRREGMHSDTEIQGEKYHPPMTRSKTCGEERTYKDRSLSDAGNSAKEAGDKSSGCYYFGTCNVQRQDFSGLEDMDIENRWEGICSHKEIQGKKYHSPMTRSKSHWEERTYRNRSSSDAAYKELIDLYLKNVDTTLTKGEPSITDQWAEYKATSDYGQNDGAEADGEVSEIDMLWKEMEVALASFYVFDNTEDSKAVVSSETAENSDKLCQHEFRLNEEIGIYCCRCGFVKTEIKDISPPFGQNLRWQHDEKQCDAGNSEAKADENDSLHLLSDHTSTDMPASEENDIWGLIPKLTSKLHVHQKKAFEFLWKNISGSVQPASVKAASKRIGGCVISHSPGAGKTFLIIAFLASYLKLFPGKRPLVLAPKTTLYTWYKEFIKWEIPIPVYLIQSRRRLGACKEKPMVIPGVPKPTGDVGHLLDSLGKIQKWHSHPSVLVMSYSYFLKLMEDNSKFSCRKYMAEVLRKSPGVLILDEGHNPRSTESCLRKALMKVETELRILLSGTLFQNNFCEYFNTLCLARPRFIHEVLRELDPKYKGDEGRAGRKPNFMERQARKFFLDKIAKKIDSDDNDDERLQGLNMLRKITNGFIDVHDGGSSDNLPGLHVYTLLVNITDFQEQIFRALYEKVSDSNRYPLEVELLVTLGAIHPWLIKTATFSDKFLTESQLSELEKCKFDLKLGPKVRFVLSLVYRVVKEEKTLIFFHYIAPMTLFVELFEKFFGWKSGREVLVLSGEQDLFERGRVIDKFEEPGGSSKVLLASITACSEGISLTAASRVILLESEWNPSRTRQAIARAFRPGQQRIVYVYTLLVTGTMEEEKYRKTTWKERVSRMIFSEDFVEGQSQWQAEKLEDDILREMIAEDKAKIFHMIMKDEKASTN